MIRLSHFLKNFVSTALIGAVMLGAHVSVAQTRSEADTAPTHNITQTDDVKNTINRILIVGDSLSSEYGIRRQTGWVELLRERLADHKPSPATVINASISGDTTSGGVSRLPALLEDHKPDLVLIELGGNDALRGLSMSMTRDNLTRMVEMAQQSGARVVLAGMQIPPNYGPVYSEAFRAVFTEVAQKTGAGLIPFLLSGLETRRDLFIEDGIHPSEEAQPIILDNVWEVIGPIIKS